MENDGVGLGEAESLGAELIEKDIVRGGKCRLVKALGLHAKDENDVGIFETFFDAEDPANGSAGRADVFQFSGNPHGRAAEREAAAEFSEKVNIGASHAAVRNVAENGDIQIGKRAFAVANGESIEQALRRMFVSAVAGVDDRNIEMARDKVGGTGGRVAHDQTIRFHGVQRVHGVEKRLAFFQAGRFRLEIHSVRAETGGGGAEADACARGVFEECQCDGFAAERSEFLERIALDALKGPALIEKKSEFVRGERFKSQKVAEAKSHICTLWRTTEKSRFN